MNQITSSSWIAYVRSRRRLEDREVPVAGGSVRLSKRDDWGKAVAGREAYAVDQHRTLELTRLDALQVGLWDRAVSGDVKAVNAVLRIIEQRSRLLGWTSQRLSPLGQEVWWIRPIGLG